MKDHRSYVRNLKLQIRLKRDSILWPTWYSNGNKLSSNRLWGFSEIMKQINWNETYQSLESQLIGSEDLNLRLPRTNPACGQGGLELGDSGLQVQRSNRSATKRCSYPDRAVNTPIKRPRYEGEYKNFHIFELREKMIIVIAKRKVNCSTEPIGK